MKTQILRKLLILAIVLLSLLLFLLLFQFTDVAFRVWDRLQNTHTVFILFYLIGITLIASAGLWLMWRIWTLGKSKPKRPKQSIAELKKRLEEARAQGLDVREIEADLARLEQGLLQLEVAFFGKISTGKSALIQTLIPNADIQTDLIGGSTKQIERYHYQDDVLDLMLVDVPGTQQVAAQIQQEEAIMAAARRAHIVVYVLDQDVTQSDWEAMQHLQAFEKPMIVALNKISRYDHEEQALLEQHLRQALPASIPIVKTNSLYWQKVKEIKNNGESAWGERAAGGEVQALLHALVAMTQERGQLDQKQRHALLSLVDDHLNDRLRHFRRERAEALVQASARKAMLGGVAAVGPGTDVIIQGYLGVNMFQALGKIYDMPLREMDLNLMIERATAKASTKWTLTLALAGNICKAFPGLGTVLGGASHAVAYGLIFESLGRAAIDALESGSFDTQQVLQHFEEQLNHDLEKRAKSLVKNLINKG